MSKADAMPTKYQPQQVEAGKYQKWVEAGLFKPSGRQEQKTVFNRDSASKRNRQTALGPCLGCNAAGYVDPPKTHARIRYAVVAWDGPRRHRHPSQG